MNLTEKEIEEIYKEAEATGSVADRNETLSSDDVEITLPTKLEQEAAEKEALNPEYDIYDTDEDWTGED